MQSPDITDLDILIDDLLLDTQPTKPTGVSISLPTYDDDDTQHLYSLKIPMSLWHLLKLHVGKGHIAEFIRNAIAEKLARNHFERS